MVGAWFKEFARLNVCAAVQRCLKIKKAHTFRNEPLVSVSTVVVYAHTS